jgi:hypothetical protein
VSPCGVEAGLPRLHEQALADRGAGLLLGDLGGTLLQTEPAHAETDGAGGDDDDLGALCAERGDLAQTAAMRTV